MKLKKVTKVVNESVGPIDVGVADDKSWQRGGIT